MYSNIGVSFHETVPLRVHLFIQADLDCVGRGGGLLGWWRRAPPPRRRRPPARGPPKPFFNIFKRVKLFKMDGATRVLVCVFQRGKAPKINYPEGCMMDVFYLFLEYYLLLLLIFLHCLGYSIYFFDSVI